MAAAGTITDLQQIVHRPVKKVRWAWTSDASGNVNGGAGLTNLKYTGRVSQIVTIPDGSTAPTDNYDITVLNEDGVDLLNGAGANRDSSATEMVNASLTTVDNLGVFTSTIVAFGSVVESTLELRVANAGNAKKGVAIIYIE